MAVRNITIYECDLCKKNVEKEGDLRKTMLPCKEEDDFYMDNYELAYKDGDVDCCNECIEKIAKLLAKHIGYYDIDEGKFVLK